MNPIVCPVRNGLSYTKAAVPTFHAQNNYPFVIFIDNSSSDGTGEYLRSLRSNRGFYWYRNPPMGVAASWNLALNWLFAGVRPRAEYALVVNNDVLLQPCTYQMLLADGGEFVTANGVGSMEQFNQTPQPQSKHPHPDFSCFLIRRSCWQKVGPFDEGYEGAYCEDLDYHVRMFRAGVDAHSICLPFYHPRSGTLKSAEPKEAEAIMKRADRNRQRFFEKYGCLPETKEYEALFECHLKP